MKFIIDPEFESLLRPLSKDEREKLEKDILAIQKVTEPFHVWPSPEGNLILIDGHNRYDICLKHDLPWPEPTLHPELPDREAVKSWMRNRQRGRRNLSPDQQRIEDVHSNKIPPGYSLQWSRAKILVDQAPAFAARVTSGELTLGQAYNAWTRSKEGPKPKRSHTMRAPKGRIHIVIGDTQVRSGVPLRHLEWIGRYIVDQFAGENVAIIHLGDHWDMPSLSPYDEGKKAIEGKRYIEDVEVGNAAFKMLHAPVAEAMRHNRSWKPELHFLFGNHEARITRACNDTAILDGKISLNDLDTQGWTRHTFLEPVIIDGITYAHYFIAKSTGRPLGGEHVETRLKTVGTSFTMGHQQGRKWAERELANGKRICGLVLGSTYLHDEEYQGPQGNKNWRGIVVKHQVEDGQYDPMFVSLDYLCRRYEGKTLADYMRAV